VLLLPYQYSARFIEHEDSVYAHRASELFSPAVLDNIKNYGSASSERIVYKVKKGDYLGKIAARYHVSVNNIKKWNNLRSNNLSIGQKLVIYQKGSSKPAAPATAKPAETVTQKPAEGQTSANTGQEAADSSMVNGQAEVAAPDSLKVSDTDSVTEVADGESVKGGNETSDGQVDDSSRRTAAENGGNREADAGDAGVDSSAADSSKAKDAAKQADESAGKDSSAQASTAAKEAAEAVIYVVKKGDTLYGIAAKYPGVSARNIMDYNGIGSNIRPGMKLRIPVRSR
ncbi:MAG: LysM peptidoglycan-binding domain-containing protein, partial [Bacteroidales bacterium]|nr:LysM peptidoglycan-binding domain-containing protein [Bacteroidales bacterium]